MLTVRSTVGRLALPAVVAAWSVLAVLLAPPAAAAGTGGIEVTPLPSVVDGEPVTAFHVAVPRGGSTSVRYRIRNVDPVERSARVYSAAVQRDCSGSFSLDAVDSSPYVRMPDRTVTLAPGESIEQTFLVRTPEDERFTDEVQAAVVVEVRNGSVVQRASTLVYLESRAPLPVPVLLAAAAAALALGVGAAALLVRRSRRGRPAADPR